jgi:putative Holliday junction resolvase
MSAILGIDLGERRIGVAIVDDPAAGARPLTTIRRGRDVAADLAALRPLIDADGVDELIVGLPLEAAGHEGSQAKRTRAGSIVCVRASGAASRSISRTSA